MHPISLPPRRAVSPARFFLSLFSTLAGWSLLCIGLALLPGCKPRELQALLQPSQALGSVLAEECARAAGTKKQVALITYDASRGPASTAEQALRDALKQRGFTVVVAKAADLGDPMKSGRLALNAADFFEALEKSAGAGAVISMVGAPSLNEGEVARLNPTHPPVLVVATASLGDKMGVHGDPVQLAQLLEAKVIQLAIIDGADPAAQASANSDPMRQQFAQNYQILRRPE
jgi:hypothetical protein